MKLFRVRAEVGMYVVNVIVHARYHEEAEREAEPEIRRIPGCKKDPIRTMATMELVLP